MQAQFRTYDLAVEFYKVCKLTQLPGFLKTQLLRAASSVALNLREGDSRMSRADRRRFFDIALASAREVKAIIALEDKACAKLAGDADKLTAHVFCLRRALL